MEQTIGFLMKILPNLYKPIKTEAKSNNIRKEMSNLIEIDRRKSYMHHLIKRFFTLKILLIKPTIWGFGNTLSLIAIVFMITHVPVT